ELVPGGGEPHGAVPVHRALAIHIPPGQDEVALRPQSPRLTVPVRRPLPLGSLGQAQSPAHRYSGSQPSWAMVIFSVRTLVSPAFREPISRFFTQQFNSL